MTFGFGFGPTGGGGSLPANKSVNVSATATGRLVSLSRYFGSTSTFAIGAGTNANLQLDNGDGIKAVAALGAGTSQDFWAQETAADGRQLLIKYTCVGAPVKPSVPAVTLTPGNGQISVGWTDGSNGGSPITQHKIYDNGVLIASPTGPSPYVITGLPNGVPHGPIQVSAVNAVGEGDLSTGKSTTPAAGSAITNLTVMGNSVLPDGADAAIGNGWVAAVALPDDGVSTFDPTKLSLSVQDGTKTRTVKGRQIVRRQYPNQLQAPLNSASGGTRTVYISLDDRIYSTSTILGATAAAGYYGPATAGAISTVGTSSTWPVEQGGCGWYNMQHERVTGDYYVELFAGHKYPVSKVEFYAKDASGNTTPTQTVLASQRILSTIQTGGQKGECYPCTIPVANLNQGDICQVFARLYDYFGRVVLDLETQGEAWPTAVPETPLRFKNDKTGAFGGAIAFVGPGVASASPAVSTNMATAKANYYATVAAAHAAIAAFNNTNKGHNNTAGSTIYVMDNAGAAYTHVLSTMSQTIGGDCWCDIRPDPAATGALLITPPASGTINIGNFLRFYVPMHQPTAATVTPGNGNTAGSMIAFDKIAITHGVSTSFPMVVGGNLRYYRDCTISGVTANTQSPLVGYATNNAHACAMVLGCTISNSTAIATTVPFFFVGNYCEKVLFGEYDTATYPTAYRSDGGIVYNNKTMKMAGPNGHNQGFGHAFTRGFFRFQNLAENISASTVLWAFAADGSSKPINNFVSAHNTLMGRCNFLYTDNDAAVGVQKNGVSKFDIMWLYPIKTDTFNGAGGTVTTTGRTGNWAPRYAVGCMGIIALNNSISATNAPGANSWLGDDFQGKFACTGVGFVNNAASEGNGSAGTGGGDYHLIGSSNDAYGMVPSGEGLLKFDMDGNLRRTDGTSAAGCYERTV